MGPEEVQQWLCRSKAGTPVYLVGISGCGMVGLGHLLMDRGFEVFGSDMAWNEFSCALADRNGVVHQGHDAAYLSRACPELVIYSSAIPRDNPELVVAQRLGIPAIRRATFLAAVMATQRSVCVVGMHGKTTTAGLLSYVLRELGVPSSYAVGGDVPQLPVPAAYVDDKSNSEDSSDVSPWFVAEVDESDGGLGDFNPQESIILNIDDEHLDYFVSIDRVRSEFGALVDRTWGGSVFCADDTDLSEMFSKRSDTVSYGYHPLADYRIELKPFDYAQPTVERFGLWSEGKLIGEFTLQLSGRANVSNAAAVIVWLLRQGCSVKQIAGAVAKFKGVRRRQDVLFADSRFRVIDDYAHHPTEIRETIQAVKRYAANRLIAVFQPHRYTRTEQLIKKFAECFDGADRVWLTEIYGAHEKPIPGVSGEALAEAMRERNRQPDYEPSLDRLRERLYADLVSGDMLLFLGAGEITRVAHQLATELKSDRTQVAPEFIQQLEADLSSGSVVALNEPLTKRTTLRVGGPADVFVEPGSLADLSAVLRRANEYEIPVFVLGRGSNVLIRDSGIRGVVLSLAQPAFSKLLVQRDKIVCGAGARLKFIASEARRIGLTGLEFLEGIPGTLGGALRMNAGAMGTWMFDVVEKVRFVDYGGQIHERAAEELCVEYRGCPLLKNHLAIEAVLCGQPSTEAAVRERMNRFSVKRWESQPAALSAGCIFKNPTSIPAGKLIEELGLKGTCVGGASVSDVHGNFIVNDGSATAEDILNLIDLVQNRARQARGIELKTEVQIIGR
ncbi:MAG: UDP-N-acetylmuramate--L-alanine ligase [Verrucomicrobia subdivision 3 bacterium]|nr:UDP-N-acetylmuramate--L-alanine ligase [Limisphaerales bacterium]MCS1412388.1 UDP-N-acetylmuramate--L-alanine ligase [Limisphaerales bacterium]